MGSNSKVHVLFSRHYRVYSPGEEAWFFLEEAETIEKYGFGRIVQTSEETSQKADGKAGKARSKGRYMDRQLRSQETT